jgi:hypothetical protein
MSTRGMFGYSYSISIDVLTEKKIKETSNEQSNATKASGIFICFNFDMILPYRSTLNPSIECRLGEIDNYGASGSSQIYPVNAFHQT